MSQEGVGVLGVGLVLNFILPHGNESSSFCIPYEQLNDEALNHNPGITNRVHAFLWFCNVYLWGGVQFLRASFHEAPSHK